MLWQERHLAARSLDSGWDLAICPQKTGQFSVSLSVPRCSPVSEAWLEAFLCSFALWDSLDRIHKEVCPLLNFFLHVLVCVYIFNSLKHTLNRLISW